MGKMRAVLLRAATDGDVPDLEEHLQNLYSAADDLVAADNVFASAKARRAITLAACNLVGAARSHVSQSERTVPAVYRDTTTQPEQPDHEDT